MSYLILSSWGELITLVLFNQQNEALVNLKKAKQMYFQKQQELEKVCYNPCKVLWKASPWMMFYLLSLSDPQQYTIILWGYQRIFKYLTLVLEISGNSIWGFFWKFWLGFILDIISKTDFQYSKVVFIFKTDFGQQKSVLEVMSSIKPNQKFQEKSLNKIPGNFQDQSQIFENVLLTPYCMLLSFDLYHVMPYKICDHFNSTFL